MRTTNVRWTLISTIAALSMSALPAMAHGGGEHRDPASLIKHFDKNGDGKLEVAELPDHLKERLAPADTNKDGVLSVEEITARWEAMKADRKAKMDTNGDGQISQEERDAFRAEKQKEHFAKMDKNSDGEISEEEAGRFWTHLSAADADKNGMVSYAEMTQAIANGTLKPPGHRGHHHDKDDADTKS